MPNRTDLTGEELFHWHKHLDYILFISRRGLQQEQKICLFMLEKLLYLKNLQGKLRI